MGLTRWWHSRNLLFPFLGCAEVPEKGRKQSRTGAIPNTPQDPTSFLGVSENPSARQGRAGWRRRRRSQCLHPDRMGGSGEGSQANTGAAAKPAGSGDSELGQGRPRAATGGDPEFLGLENGIFRTGQPRLPFMSASDSPKSSGTINQTSSCKPVAGTEEMSNVQPGSVRSRVCHTAPSPRREVVAWQRPRLVPRCAQGSWQGLSRCSPKRVLETWMGEKPGEGQCEGFGELSTGSLPPVLLLLHEQSE